jgi:hypothetical protein
MTVDKLVIDRSKWGTGFLLRPLTSTYVRIDGPRLQIPGKMCCLGFLAKACGATDDEIYCVPMPTKELAVKYDINGLSTNFVPSMAYDGAIGSTPMANDDQFENKYNYWWDAASRINDGTLAQPQKELKLIKLFKDHGIELTFIGEM